MCCSELDELSQTLNQMDVNNSAPAPSLPLHSHSIVIEDRSSNTGLSNRQLQQQQRLRGSTTRGPTSLQHSTQPNLADLESRDCTYSPAVVQQRNNFMAGILSCRTVQHHASAAGTDNGSQRHHSNHISSCGSATDLVEFLHSNTQPAHLRRRSLLFASDSNGGSKPQQPATSPTNYTSHNAGLGQGASGTSHSSHQNDSYASSSSAVLSSFQHAVSSREHTFSGSNSKSHAPSIPNAPANHPAWFSGFVTSNRTSLPSFPSQTHSCGPDGGRSSAGQSQPFQSDSCTSSQSSEPSDGMGAEFVPSALLRCIWQDSALQACGYGLDTEMDNTQSASPVKQHQGLCSAFSSQLQSVANMPVSGVSLYKFNSCPV